MSDAPVSKTRLFQEAGKLLKPFWPIVSVVTVIGVIGGSATGLLLASVNRGLHQPGDVSSAFLLRFTGLCALVLGGRVIAGIGNSTVGQRLIAHMRKRIAGQALAVPLRAVERFGAHRVLAVLNDDIDHFSAFTFNISSYCISAAVAIGCLAYLAFLSPILFPVAAFALGAGLWLNFATRKRWNGYYAEVRRVQDDLQKQYRAVTDAAKELRMSRERRVMVLDERLSAAADGIADLKIRAMRLYWSADATGSTLFFMVIGALLAVKGRLGIGPEAFSGFVITLLFVKGPIDQILTGLPMAGLAMVSLGRIAGLSEMLEHEEKAPPALQADRRAFETIALHNICYTFDDGFTVGPISLNVRRGETLFLVGENGAGKTTLIKLLTGLYTPGAGHVTLDGDVLTPSERPAYMELFGGVFADYFLFADLPRHNAAISAEAAAYLERFQIAHKAQIENGAFTTTDLSTGQRKRLALIQAWLEDRPILVFDEWAADQDPEFRKIFYHEILPDMRRQGKTLIVVSHDDRFFSAADRVVWLKSGHMDREETPAAATQSTV